MRTSPRHRIISVICDIERLFPPFRLFVSFKAPFSFPFFYFCDVFIGHRTSRGVIVFRGYDRIRRSSPNMTNCSCSVARRADFIFVTVWGMKDLSDNFRERYWWLSMSWCLLQQARQTCSVYEIERLEMFSLYTGIEVRWHVSDCTSAV